MKHLALMIVIALTFPLPSQWEDMSFKEKFHSISNMMEKFLSENQNCKRADFTIFGTESSKSVIIKCKEE